MLRCWMKIIFPFLALLLVMTVQAKPLLRWGADPSGGAPYVYIDPTHSNQYIGFEIEFVEALAERIGYQAKLIPNSWDSLVPSLQRGEYDVIVNGFERSSDSPEYIDQSNPYYLFQLQLTVRKGNYALTKLEDCRNCTVGALANSAAVRILKSKNIHTKEYSDPASPYQDLLAGRIEAVLADLPIAMAYGQNPQMQAGGPPSNMGAYVIGIRKNNTELLEKINLGIDKMIEDGSLKMILSNWGLWNDLQERLTDGDNFSSNIPSESFDWWGALFRLTKAAGVTAMIAIGSMIIALVIGIPLAVIQLKAPLWGRFLIGIFVEFFRGTPILVLLFFLYFGLPIIGITIPGWLTALVGLGLNYAAYESQVYRNAFEAIPKGQWEAAACLGMNHFQTFKRIILPQGFRVALPPMTNDFVSLFKDTSVVFAISVWELATAYRELANSSQQYFLLSLVTCFFYLAMSVPLSRYARYLERSLKRQHKKKSTRLATVEVGT